MYIEKNKRKCIYFTNILIKNNELILLLAFTLKRCLMTIGILSDRID
jgi:hypothetical protein